MSLTITIALVSSLTSGLAVAVLNHFLGRKRASMEQQKMGLEIQGLRAEVDYKVSPAIEQIIYDSRKSSALGYDFTAVEGRHWSDGRHVGEKASGELQFLNGMIDILRTNDHGKYGVRLKQYSYGRFDSKEVLSQNPAISGKRRLRVSCEVKILESPHSLRFLFKSEPGGVWLASHEIVVDTKRIIRNSPK